MKRLFIRPLHLLCPAAVCLLLATAAISQEEATDSATDTPAAAESPAAEAPAKEAEAPAAAPAKEAEAPAEEAASAPAEQPAAPPAEQPAADDTAPAPPAEKAPAEKAPAEKAATDVQSAAAAFAGKLDEWKALLGQMRQLRTEYDAADEGDLVPIVKRWNDMLASGEDLIDELRATGIEAYVAAPNEDRELTRFLVKILEDDYARDAHENAALLSHALVDNGYDNNDTVNIAAVSAFNTNNYEKAQAYLAQAQERGELSEAASRITVLVDEYRGFWEEEQEIRKKEAEADDLPRVKITTNKGEVVVELFENEAPGAVGNFVSLVEKGFYDGLTFHRVMENFMAQGGCPQGTGGGGPGYEIFCECERADYRRHFRGTLSMAHAGKDTGGSQFFMTFVPTAHLNGKHTAFGRIIEGMDVLAKLQRTEGESNDKAIPDKIVKMEVLRKREHPYEPNKVQ